MRECQLILTSAVTDTPPLSHTHSLKHARTYTQTHTRTTHVHTHARARTHTHTHTHAHTHTEHACSDVDTSTEHIRGCVTARPREGERKGGGGRERGGARGRVEDSKVPKDEGCQ